MQTERKDVWTDTRHMRRSISQTVLLLFILQALSILCLIIYVLSQPIHLGAFNVRSQDELYVSQ